MSQETFLACDNPECAKATRLESDDEEGDAEELEIDACSIDCLVAAVGPAVLATYLKVEPAT